jgi:hypothetical protein
MLPSDLLKLIVNLESGTSTTAVDRQLPIPGDMGARFPAES